MAKRRAPDPAVTERWADIISSLTKKLGRRQQAAAETKDELDEAIRSAFDEGVLVGPIKEATGLSGSRCYQIKFALRDQQQHDTAS